MPFIVSLFLIFLMVGCSPEEELAPKIVRPVQVMEIKEALPLETYAFPGRTRASDRVNLSFRVSGPLVKLPVEVGDEVEVGDLLAQIDPRDFKKAVQRAEAKVQKTKADLTFAENDYQRAVRIHTEDPGAISQSQLDRKKEDRNRLQAEIEELETEWRATKDSLADTEMKAPFPGVITARFVENFEYVQSKQSILRLLGTKNMEMVVDVPESLMGVVTQNPQVTIRLDSFPDEIIPTRIKEIGQEASASTRTFPITLAFKAVGNIPSLAGMVGEGVFSQLATKVDDRGFAILTTALFTRDDGKSYVWILDPDTMLVKSKQVQLKKVIGQGKALITGVKIGDLVITAGTHFLHDGQEVSIFKE